MRVASCSGKKRSAFCLAALEASAIVCAVQSGGQGRGGRSLKARKEVSRHMRLVQSEYLEQGEGGRVFPRFV